VKPSNIRFHGNPFSYSQVVTYRWMDGWMVIFYQEVHRVANAPKNTYLSPETIPQTCTVVLISIAHCKATVHRRKITTSREVKILSFQYSTGAFQGSRIHTVGINTQ
jgi:hypothetical protein